MTDTQISNVQRFSIGDRVIHPTEGLFEVMGISAEKDWPQRGKVRRIVCVRDNRADWFWDFELTMW